ncbi:NADPH-dependent FMN reductase [Flexibacterium corallicola]|uniref:NADPH-dependent FMN reductase n=1 Tax=Flexibacterium corallicola TaxID=3037259 RepID=UPI00286F1920|nr:NAD(P)H-dependent oxidoreductase [Pseudovibrio sp. M1P-2-3]
MQNTKVLLICGSNRTGSFNQQIMNAVESLLQKRGFQFETLQAEMQSLPIYTQDKEQDESFRKLTLSAQLKLAQADLILVASPDYNGFFPPILSNILTWISRDFGKGRPLRETTKVAGLISASPGNMGGIRMLPNLRDFLIELGAVVHPTHVVVPQVNAKLDENGLLVDEEIRNKLNNLITSTVALLDGIKPLQAAA